MADRLNIRQGLFFTDIENVTIMPLEAKRLVSATGY
jgi:hypothetical protein